MLKKKTDGAADENDDVIQKMKDIFHLTKKAVR